ncbi:uncharacterized protein B0I36DRAFT_339349 [Microdochium trichocladiopsis]|uniref:Zn(2)-C6 fungal-type domain-containing protein n=1 Tax=Microdochium trichocladiopsis TaxID=1682393 RepID=A0A9P8XSW5_9PEZI|nr:uncharacterized protein B0I36DRAFT_339349 [Microdochium trichocladiopsis]KAH7012476.1 hypothetical protein B0I36DRAFT_339349 [Microdochium trichocladiopsis]
MTDPADPAPAKPRVRAFSHRTRAGCLTCKTRRKKCDEQRPICNRCKVGGFICDGYEADGAARKQRKPSPATSASSSSSSPPSSSSSSSPSASGRSLPILVKKGRALAPLKPAPVASAIASAIAVPVVRGPLLPGDARDTQYYVWFFTNTVGDLVMSHSFSTAFWHKMFQPSSQNAACVRHAVVALGAIHWQFSRHDAAQLTSPPLPSSQKASLDRFALQHYNQAISSLVKARDTTNDMVTTVTCCFLFVLLESLRGEYGEALRHLEAGMTILADHQPTTALPNREVQELASMFHPIGCEVGVFAETRLFPDISRFQAPMKKYKRRTNELRDLDEAEDVMNTRDDLITLITIDLEQDWDNPDSDCNTQWELLRISVQNWNVQFNALVDRMLRDGEYDDNIQKITNLKLQYKMWELLMEVGDECDAGGCPASSYGNGNSTSCNGGRGSYSPLATVPPDVGPTPGPPAMDAAECSALLDEVDKLWYSTTTPRFALKTDLLTAIFQLYVFCLDEDVRLRIINMLRARRRREIIWDSAALADFLERDMEQRRTCGGERCERWPNLGPSPSAEALVVFRPKKRHHDVVDSATAAVQSFVQ